MAGSGRRDLREAGYGRGDPGEAGSNRVDLSGGRGDDDDQFFFFGTKNSFLGRWIIIFLQEGGEPCGSKRFIAGAPSTKTIFGCTDLQIRAVGWRCMGRGGTGRGLHAKVTHIPAEQR
uniref:Uncharacterized protein n=1 Tax=Leersia perrieri TaxID=77586 RepID=A0A0D9VXB1_9ORYZ